jgi:hypothetical protein
VSITANHCQPLPITANHCQPLPITANHCQPLPTTANHCQPLPTTANHCQPLPTIANHHHLLLDLTMCLVPGLIHGLTKAEPRSSAHTSPPMLRPRDLVLSGWNPGLSLRTASTEEAATVAKRPNNNYHRTIKINASSLYPI